MFKLIFFSLSLSALIANAQQPLCLIENKGQVTDQSGKPRRDIDYKIPGNGVNVFVGSGGLHYQFVNHDLHDFKDRHDEIFNPQRSLATVQDNKVDMYRLDVELLNARKDVQAVAEQKTGYFENYYLPQCPDGVTAHAYDKITYKDVYPNIDWVVYIKNGKAEYDFVVKEGGKVKDIQLQYKGAASLTKNADGSITATTPMGTVSEAAPVCYDASGKKVNALFIVENNTISFSTENYKGQLTIDPTLQWGTYYGGNGKEITRGLYTDLIGSIYLVGSTASNSNIATTGSFQVTLGGVSTNGNGDLFLTKFSANGTRQWATYYGGTNDDAGLTISGDGNDNLYISGMSNSTGLATTGSHQTVYGGGSSDAGDAIILNFDKNGNRKWATYYGGGGDESGYSIIYKAGFLYLLGGTNGSIGTSIATPGSHQPTYGGGFLDAFLVKFDTSGVRQWGTYYGGTDVDLGYKVIIDGNSNVIIVGTTSSLNNIATTGIHQTVFAGTTSGGFWGGDAFLAKFDSSGDMDWGTYYGGNGKDWGWSLTNDEIGNVYIAGHTQSDTGISTSGSHQTTFVNSSGNYGDGYVAKFNINGLREWATYYGNSGEDAFHDVEYKSGKLHLVGRAGSLTDITTQDAYQTINSGGEDAMYIIFDTMGTLQYGTFFGGTSQDVGYNIELNDDGSIYLAGITSSTSNIATGSGHQQNIGGGIDAFLVKFNDTALSVKPSLVIPANTIHLYPNPNAGGFTLTGSIASRDGKATITVMDVMGRTVAQEDAVVINNKLQQEVNINTLLPAGMYMVQVTTDSGRQVLQMVKE